MSVVINGSAGVTTNSGAVYDGIQRGTAVTASGTSVDFTSIPSWVRRITVMLSGVSTNGASNPLIQVGAGSVTTSGYLAGSVETTTRATYTTGFGLVSSAAANLLYGHIVITNLTSNTWVCSYTLYLNQTLAYICAGGGNVTLSGVLDRVRITTVNGTDTFDAGTINILYE
jgi:hypothetical protein